ncbi:SusC/RagA family TonB-linked outer membrane protein [Chitinophaga defluvii]|uniref:SusC/RagA family TonB-linked outer membrane protein n=1 Tax=Chitinophaga defluvii TaxID=3163343 RepID=A0ABV2TE11_9BACT
MRLTILLLIIACLKVTAASYAQTITYSGRNVPLEKVFAIIRQQTGYVTFCDYTILEKARPVTIEAQDTPLKDFLAMTLKDQALQFSLKQQTIIISLRPEISSSANRNATAPGADSAQIRLTGTVMDADGNPLPGASVRLRDGQQGTVTDANGYFVVEVAEGSILEVSFIGYQIQRLRVKNSKMVAMQDGSNAHLYTNGSLQIKLEKAESQLNAITINKGYYTEKRRLSTGNVSTVSAKEIACQPVSNPLAALAGRVPGLEITQSSGVPGSGFKVLLRGQSSLLQGSQPLFVIDGVPFASGNTAINQLSSAAGAPTSGTGMSPMNMINPADIESIEVLKDADATAIYGSRGANGVILITTKKGATGPMKADVTVYKSWSRAARTMAMLNTEEYRAMRYEAFRNDGVPPTTANAPDLFWLDSTRYTDFRQLMIGGTAETIDGQVRLSGGTIQTRYSVGAGYHKETTVFPTDLGNTRAGFNTTLQSTSADNKFNLDLTASYSITNNKLVISDLTRYTNTNPMLKLYKEDGSLNWEEHGEPYANLGISDSNPMKFLFENYHGRFRNLNSNLRLSYLLLPHLKLRVNLGYNVVQTDEKSASPSTSIDPFSQVLPSASFANKTQANWILEPQIEYGLQAGPGKLSVLAGSTWQESRLSGVTVYGYDYTSDVLLGSIAAAGRRDASNTDRQYNYQGVYGRLNYNVQDKYLVNISGRRDGSSRFGPQSRFSNFGAVGAAWIFSEEQWVQRALPFLSFGKLRGSIGLTGNDQIGDYRYLNTWSTSSFTYDGTSSLNPTALFNPVFAWERNSKTELSLDLGLLKDRLMLSLTWFRNKASNQLVNYTLPSQTGFESVLANLNALIENKGWELQVTGTDLLKGAFRWNSSFNISFPVNKLLDFPGLATSSYRNTYIIGKAVSMLQQYRYQGIDPATGSYLVEDVDGDGMYGIADRVSIINRNPKYYGGFQNTFRYQNFELTVALEFRKQTGTNYMGDFTNSVPGYGTSNQPRNVLQRWQQKGDETIIPRFSATNTDVLMTALNYRMSDGIYTDASFIRGKNISISYHLPGKWMKKTFIGSCRIYFDAQNLFVITGYKGADPENQDLYTLPPLKTIAGGIQLNF